MRPCTEAGQISHEEIRFIAGFHDQGRPGLVDSALTLLRQAQKALFLTILIMKPVGRFIRPRKLYSELTELSERHHI